mgnify:CR=1 FL=1
MSAHKPLRSWRVPILLGLTILVGLAATYSRTRPRPGCGGSTVLNQATGLETSVNCFFSDYGYLPGNKERLKTDGPDGIMSLRVLLGMERSGNPLNTREVKYLIAKEGKIDRGGLIYTKAGDDITGLYDSWGNPYVVLLDTDNDGTLAFRWGDHLVELKGRRAAVFTPGEDHKEAPRTM